MDVSTIYKSLKPKVLDSSVTGSPLLKSPKPNLLVLSQMSYGQIIFFFFLGDLPLACIISSLDSGYDLLALTSFLPACSALFFTLHSAASYPSITQIHLLLLPITLYSSPLHEGHERANLYDLPSFLPSLSQLYLTRPCSLLPELTMHFHACLLIIPTKFILPG